MSHVIKEKAKKKKKNKKKTDFAYVFLNYRELSPFNWWLSYVKLQKSQKQV